MPKITRQHDFVMVVVDKVTKVVHFIPIKIIHKEANIPEFYIKEIARIHVEELC